MALVNAICPNCGATIQVDDKAKAAVCKYCNSPYVVSDGIEKYNIEHQVVGTQTIRGKAKIEHQIVTNQTIIHEVDQVVSKTIKTTPYEEDKIIKDMAIFGWYLDDRDEVVVSTRRDEHGNVIETNTKVVLLMKRKKELDQNEELRDLEVQYRKLCQDISKANKMTLSQKLIITFVVLILVGIGAIGFGATCAGDPDATAITIGSIVLGSLALVGAIVGLVFGIKKYPNEKKNKQILIDTLIVKERELLEKIKAIVEE